MTPEPRTGVLGDDAQPARELRQAPPPPARLREICARCELPARAAERFADLLRLIAADEHAPTTVRDPSVAVDVHLADSLSALSLPAARDARAILDLGAGAGFPGLPLAIALPHAQVTLLDSNHRKCAFLATTVRALGLENAAVVCARAESWADGRDRHDLVVARAVAAQAVVLEYAAPLLAPAGTLVEWRGERDAHGERDGAAAATRLGLQLEGVELVAPFAAAQNHHLHVFVKVAPTPPGFPRRPGIAQKRPLKARSQR